MSKNKPTLRSLILDEDVSSLDLGSTLKKAVEELWQADALLNSAIASAPDDRTYKELESFHKKLQELAFAVDSTTTTMGRPVPSVTKRALPARPRV